MVIKNKKEWKSILEKKDVIFVNIFNTVILNNYASMEIIYELMEKEFYQEVGLSIMLSKILIELENYDPLNKYDNFCKLGFTKEICEKLKSKEFSLIRKYSSAREWFKSEYAICIEKGKKVYFINNSNLPNDIVNTMLKEFGYQNEVYTDEVNGDVYQIQSESELYAKQQLDIALDEAVGNLYSFNIFNNSNGFKQIKQILVNKLFDDPFKDWKKESISNAEANVVGYYYLSMHILGVILWLSDNVEKNRSKKLYFCSRDGFLFFRAYQIYCKYVEDEMPEAEYLYISRKMLLPSLYSDKRDFLQLPDHYSQFSPQTTLLLFWDFNICSTDNQYRYEDFIKYEPRFVEELEHNNVDYYTNFDSWEDYYLFIGWFLDNYYSREKHMKRLSELRDYYSRIGAGDYLFDLGYSGRLQWGVSRICNNEFKTLYVMPDISNIEVMRERGLKFETYYDLPFYTSNVFREFLVSEACPSYIGISCKEGKTMPQYETNPRLFKKSKGLSEIQEASIKAIEDIFKMCGMDIKHFHINEKVLSFPWEGYIRNIPRVDLELYSELYQEEYHTGKFVYSSWKERYLAEHADYPEIIGISSKERVKLKNINIMNKRIVLFGAGNKCYYFLKKYQYISPIFIVDNDDKKQGKFIEGLPVFSLEQIGNLSLYYFIIAVEKVDEIKWQLRKAGLQEKVDFIWYKELET